MIDIHAHILSCGDDGASTLDDSLKMSEAFSQNEITVVVATPHFIRGSCEIGTADIFHATEVLNQVLTTKNIKLKILPGMEIEICHDMISLLKKGKLLTLNNTGKYLLVELPFHSIPSFTYSVFYELKLMGVTPILAHPERNIELCEHPELVTEIYHKGVFMQVNAGSILGYFGSKVKQTALSMMERNLVHLVGGDAHQSKGERGPCLHLVNPILEKHLGKEKTKVIIRENPMAVLEGREITYWEPLPLPRGMRKLMGRIFG